MVILCGFITTIETFHSLYVLIVSIANVKIFTMFFLILQIKGSFLVLLRKTPEIDLRCSVRGG